jgi:maltose O-acetyltransferase
MASELEKMLAGELYRPADAAIQAALRRNQLWLAQYNTSHPDERAALLRIGLGFAGDGIEVRPPFHCDFGSNISIGHGAFLNFGCVILDVVAVTIGAGAQIGPGVHIYAADHPRGAQLRGQGLELGRPVAIGVNVWIGGGAILLPGVSIGADAIIGAGSVVTRDVPPATTVVGNPARVKEP